MEEDNSTLSIEKDIFDLVKENMVQERKWNLEIIKLLKDQIDYLKSDIIHKNTNRIPLV